MPSPETVDRAVAAFRRWADYQYFFERLTSPSWIEPLWERGLFRNPPDLVREGQYVQLPSWPESRYLARMAGAAPELVFKVIVGMADTQNVRVFEDLADAALAMPPEYAVQLVRQAKQWVESPFPSLLAGKLGKLTVYLAEAGYVDAAIDLAQTLLTLLPDPRAEQKRAVHFPLEPRARYDLWEYGQILVDDVPELTRVGGLTVLEMMCSLLATALDLTYNSIQRPVDFTYMSRPAIENHEQNRPYGAHVTDLLITSVRDMAEQAVKEALGTIEEVVAILESHRWNVLRRLALYVISTLAPTSRLAAKYLTDYSLFEDPSFRHEYVQLARAGFAYLPESEQEQILQWGDEGPDPEQLERWGAKYKESTGELPTQEITDLYINNWRSNAFFAYRDQIPAEVAKRHLWLAALERTETTEFASVMRSWFGPTSRLGSDDLRQMTITELITFFKQWEPTGDFMSDSREGLARVLASEVAANPERYAESALSFQDVDDAYVAGLFEGWKNAAEQHRRFQWEPVLELCSAMLPSTERSTVALGDNFTQAERSWVRVTMAWLLEMGFDARTGDAAIPYELRELAWGVLEPLTNDSDPTPSVEEAYGVRHSTAPGASWDPASLAINTVRGIAMHALIHYALWVAQGINTPTDNDPQTLHWKLDQMPEVEHILESHLDPTRDPSLAIRSVYGQFFPTLVYLSADWARRNVERIFPQDQEQPALRHAAWSAFILFTVPNEAVFKMLREEYARAIKRLATSGSVDTDAERTDARLAEHLMVFYWHGTLTLDDDVLKAFFGDARNGTRGHALEFIGRNLRHVHDSSDSISPEVIAQLMALWEHRVSVATSAKDVAPYVAELTAFGDWFGSMQFEDRWAIRQLKFVLERTGSVKSSHLVLERLAALVSSMPVEVMECVRLLIEGDKHGWEVSIWRDSLEQILRGGLQGGGSAQRAATEVVNLLGARGYRDIGRLLTDSTTS